MNIDAVPPMLSVKSLFCDFRVFLGSNTVDLCAE